MDLLLFSVMANRKGRSSLISFMGPMEVSSMTTAVTAAASVPSSFTLI